MRMKRTSGALITSLGLHLLLAFIAGIYLITQTPYFQEIIIGDILQLPTAPTSMLANPIFSC